jgi:molybdenum-dependent DNA-binding transcriptional regulator ModE
MNMTSIPSLADAGQTEPTDDQMQQIRELLVGDAVRRSSARTDLIEARLKDLEAEMMRRFDALSAQVEALANDLAADRRSAFDELAHGVADLGERIRHLSQR